MSTTLAWPGTPDGTRRHASLLLTVVLHGGLIAAALHGLQSTFERPAPREVVISLLSLDSAPATTAPRPAPTSPLPPAAHAPALTMPLPQPIQQATTQGATPAIPIAPVTPEAPVVSAATTGAVSPIPAASQAPAAASVAPGTRGPVTVSGVDYLSPPKVDYPITARRAGLEGRVMLRLLIDEKGQPQRADVQQSSGHPRLDEAARAAVLSALFKPHIEDGQPLPVYALVPISFSLK